MKTLKLSITAIILVFSLVTNVQAAEVSMADYRRLKDDKPFDLFFGGYLSGMTAANTILALADTIAILHTPETSSQRFQY